MSHGLAEAPPVAWSVRDLNPPDQPSPRERPARSSVVELALVGDELGELGEAVLAPHDEQPVAFIAEAGGGGLVGAGRLRIVSGCELPFALVTALDQHQPLVRAVV